MFYDLVGCCQDYVKLFYGGCIFVLCIHSSLLDSVLFYENYVLSKIITNDPHKLLCSRTLR